MKSVKKLILGMIVFVVLLIVPLGFEASAYTYHDDSGSIDFEIQSDDVVVTVTQLCNLQLYRYSGRRICREK